MTNRMKFAALAAMLVIGGGVARADAVTVCLENNNLSEPMPFVEKQVADMFRAAAVNVAWRNGFRDCPAEGIMISFQNDTPRDLKPGALAYALPYEGTHICVFYDRVLVMGDKPLVKYILAHVLVHEITHILQGIGRHSATGVMKARWNSGEISRMNWKPLAFEPIDITLIHDGLMKRNAAAGTN